MPMVATPQRVHKTVMIQKSLRCNMADNRTRFSFSGRESGEKIRKNRKLSLIGLKASIITGMAYNVLLIGFFCYVVDHTEWLYNLFPTDPTYANLLKGSITLVILLFTGKLLSEPPERMVKRIKRTKRFRGTLKINN